MATTYSGQGTTFNLPNFTGELYNVAPYETPFLSAIGGLTGGRGTTDYEFQWQSEGLESSSANNVALEGADAPAASGVVRTNHSNILEIHHEAIEVSYTKQAAVGRLSGLNTADGSNPVQDELAHQTMLKVRKVAIDVEKSFLVGEYQKPADNTTERQTRGVLNAVSTNVFHGADDGSGGYTARDLTKDIVRLALRDMWENGAPLDQASTVFMVNGSQKLALTDVFGKVEPASRTVGGVAIDTIVTDFGTFGIMLNRWQADDEIAVLDLSVCAPVFLDIPGKGRFFVEPLARTGSSESFQLYGEIGLEYGPEHYHGRILDLNTV